MVDREGIASGITGNPVPQRVRPRSTGKTDLHDGDAEQRGTEKGFAIAAEDALAEKNRKGHAEDDVGERRRAWHQQGKQQRDQDEAGLDGATAAPGDDSFP